jgi:hypothetical protein
MWGAGKRIGLPSRRASAVSDVRFAGGFDYRTRLLSPRNSAIALATRD